VYRRRKLISILGAALVIALVVAGYFAEMYWPYRYRNVKPLLEQVFASKVTVSHYHRIYWPHPGFVAKELTLRRTSAPGLPPIGSTQDLIVRGSWWDLLRLRKRIMLVDVVGLHVVIPPVGSAAMKKDFPAGSSADFAGPLVSVGELHIHKAVLDIMRVDGSRYTYPIKELVIHNLQQGQAISYFVDMQNASPVGHVVSRGSFGPLVPKNLGATRLSGHFTFAPVNLDQIGELHGIVSAKGDFSGTLTAIEAHVTGSAPDFSVSDGRRVAISGWAQCTVNGLNADVILHQVNVKTGETTVQAGGSVMGWPKVTDLQLTVTKGRPQDLLHPFLSDPSPISGQVWMKAHAHVAPDGKGITFLQRLTMDGSFDVPKERVTRSDLEKTLTQFSQRAQGEKQSDDAGSDPSTDVVSSLEGPSTVRNGVVSTQRLTFEVPGAQATLHGWYNLRGGAVHLDGNLKMKSDISHTATGFKSVLLKPLAPFFKKKKAGAVVPIAVTGKPGHYQVSSNILHQK
jgi:hypothetical protein